MHGVHKEGKIAESAKTYLVAFGVQLGGFQRVSLK